MRKSVKNNVSWVGYVDWELETFHGHDYITRRGSSQNAYLIEEEKTVLIDTVWTPHRDIFIENLEKEVGLDKIDFIVANHGERDHTGTLPALMEKIPGTPIYCTANAVKSLEGQYGKRGWDFRVVKTGDTLDVGHGKQLIFIEMRMLHWPDSMAEFLTGDNILFSMDAFGQHYATAERFNDEVDQAKLYEEALKYYANILNPFSPMVKKKLPELAAMDLPIDMICPSHGVIWRDDPMQIVEKYAQWCDDYKEDQITVVYDTMWEGTAKIAHAIADEIKARSPATVVKVFHIPTSDQTEIIFGHRVHHERDRGFDLRLHGRHGQDPGDPVPRRDQLRIGDSRSRDAAAAAEQDLRHPPSAARLDHRGRREPAGIQQIRPGAGYGHAGPGQKHGDRR